MGYHQIELDPDSREITTFATHAGLFRYKRLLFGVNSATEQYQYEIQTALAGLQAAHNISDDIIVYGTDTEEHEKRLMAVIARLDQCGLTLNSKKNIADSLSRLLPSSEPNETVSETEQYVRFIAVEATPAALATKEIERASEKDEELILVRASVQSGCWDKCPKAYLPIMHEMCVYGQLLLRGNRIVVPMKLRPQMLALAHEGHFGVVNTKQRLRSKVWWPGMEKAAEKHVKSCHACQMVSRPDPPEPIRSTELPAGPWQDVATDLMGPLPTGETLLVVVDYFSRFYEIGILHSTTTTCVLNHLDTIFSRHGLPTTIKSDNGPQFVSEQFKDYCDQNNIQHLKVTARYAQANGEVERQNQSLLKRLQTAQVEGREWKKVLNSYLLAQRSLPHATTGKSPAELLFGRKLRTKLPDITDCPYVEYTEVRDKDNEQKGRAKLYADERRGAKESSVEVGDKVLIRQDKRDKLTTTFGESPHTVVSRAGNSLVVQSDSGAEYSRNTTHVKKLVPADEIKDQSTPQNVPDESSGSLTEAEPQAAADPAPRVSGRIRRAPERYGDYVIKS